MTGDAIGYQLNEKQAYTDAMGRAIVLMHETAGNRGIVGGEVEALVDAWWCTIPSAETKRHKIPFDDEEISAADAWKTADSWRSAKVGSASKLDPIERKRILAKLRILIDTLFEMEMLFRRPRIYKTTSEDDDVEW